MIKLINLYIILHLADKGGYQNDNHDI